MSTASSFILQFTPRQQPTIFHRRKPSFQVSSSFTLPFNADRLQQEFGRQGVSFKEIGESCVVRMSLDNGSTASLMLPSGLITSYRPFMWYGANSEVLHTTVSEHPKGDVVIQGGVSMNMNCLADDGLSWMSDEWALLGVNGSSEDFIQVELVSVGLNDMLEAKFTVTLREDVLGQEIVITNQRSTSVQLLGSVLSHLSVSTPDATYAIGLQGSTYRDKVPIVSKFSLIAPDSREEKQLSFQPLASKGFDAVFSGWDKPVDVHKEDEEEEEDDDSAQMTEKMSRVYTHSPREFSILDRGKRNSVVVRRSGFEELYVFSPGSEHEWYGKYAYVCVGPSAVLKPVILSPGNSWAGAQYLFNPNL